MSQSGRELDRTNPPAQSQEEVTLEPVVRWDRFGYGMIVRTNRPPRGVQIVRTLWKNPTDEVVFSRNFLQLQRLALPTGFEPVYPT